MGGANKRISQEGQKPSADFLNAVSRRSRNSRLPSTAGTRKNAVNNLLEVGCSEAHVAAIVNMSPAMVHHYSKKVSQFRLARAAMEQFEAGWEKVRPSVPGSVKVAK
jgi:hypothetical protein